VGGNLAASAPTDLPVALAALRASVLVASIRGTRSVPVEELDLAADELITQVVVPDALGSRWAYGKLALNASAYSVAAVAVVVQPDGPTCAFAAVGPRPDRLDAAAPPGEACAGLNAVTDALADGAYRRRAAAVLLEDALLKVAGR